MRLTVAWSPVREAGPDDLTFRSLGGESNLLPTQAGHEV